MDVNVRAFRVVQEALGESSSTLSPEKAAKKAASKKGGIVGGPARARSISKQRRVEIATKASVARWRRKNLAGDRNEVVK